MRGGDYNEASIFAEASFRPSSEHVPSPASRRCRAAAYRVPYVMLCKNPFIKGTGEAYGCGQCLPCRLNRRRIWTHRIMLEAAQYADNCFVTLTYDNERMPANGSVEPVECQLWLKRLRDRISPLKVRYFLVGEYGDQTQRPHYHAALFGFPNCSYGQTRRFRNSDRPCCGVCEIVRTTWGKGHIGLGTLEPESAAYIAGYVTKKMTSPDDPRLHGRHPEFARMSLRPGLGGDAVHEIASETLRFLENMGDVPTALRHGKTIWPLGRYLTRRLRQLTGRPLNAPPITLAKMEAKVHHLRETSKAITSAPGMARFRNAAFKSAVIQENKGRIAQLETRNRIYKGKKSL